MNKFIDDNNLELDASFSLEEMAGYKGLAVESWGPKDRNPEYAKAIELVLSRLQSLKVQSINVFVISTRVIKLFPRMEDRAVIVENSKNISLIGKTPKELRLSIGRRVADLKENQNSEGGNRYKRVLIFNQNIEQYLWKKISLNTHNSSDFENYLKEPTSDIGSFEQKVEALYPLNIEQPIGTDNPQKSSVSVATYQRNPLVKAWVLKKANGFCEVCDLPAPFMKPNGQPYLEVHHLLPLAMGGSDTITNAVATCPNCHRQLHFGSDSEQIIIAIRNKLPRVNVEKSN